MSKKKFKNLVKKIASGNSQETSLDLKNNDLKDEDLNVLWKAINSPQAAVFRSKLEEIDLGNVSRIYPNRFSKVVIEDLPALKKFSIYQTAPISGGQKLILRKLPALEQIIANNNDIQEFITEDLPNIRKINLKWNMLKDFSAAQFPQLNTLAISNNRMAIVDLSGLPSLKICEIGEEQANIPTQIRTVYLGNGTTFERLYYNSFHFDSITKNILHKYKRDFKGKYRDTNNVINFPDFNLNDFKNYAAKDSISFNIDNPEERNQLEKQIKTLTARQIWRTQGLYEVSNAGDETVQKALQVIAGKDTMLQSSK